ncbi:hypothetical protein [Klebsiella quasipneumoniae]|uniref:hypothetical protein n=1 Tax=Klebsiella quasipneumoniae TaxID=1463165 RepID=UPI003EE125C0
MTKSTITREQAQKIIVAADEVITALAGTNEDVHPDDSKKMCELWDDLNDRHAPPVVVRELASMALAAMDSEPVALQPELAKVIYHFRDWNEGFPVERFKADYVISWMLANYPPAPPAPVVSADLLHTAASAIEDLLTTKDRTGACVWFDLPFRLRSAANAQPAPVVPAVSDDIGEIRVGRLPTMNQDDYPGLGDWWVQLRIGEDSDEVLARVYGATPQEANNRAEALACRAAMLSGGKS